MLALSCLSLSLWPCNLPDFSSLTIGGTCAFCCETTESWALDCQGISSVLTTYDKLTSEQNSSLLNTVWWLLLVVQWILLMTAADVRNVSMVLQGKYHSTSLSSNEAHYNTLSSAKGPQKLIDTLPTLRVPMGRELLTWDCAAVHLLGSDLT